jgi:hypothetical protein
LGFPAQRGKRDSTQLTTRSNAQQPDVALLHFVVCLKELTFECVGTSLEVVRFAPDFKIATEYVMQNFRQH